MIGPPETVAAADDRREAAGPSPAAGDAAGDELRDSDAVRNLMWSDVGLFRTRATLEPAVARLTAAYLRERRAIDPVSTADAGAWRRFNLLTVAWLIARAALRREESRGGHFREDFPARDDLHWKVHLVDTR
jgi:L-aspartate oxidase